MKRTILGVGILVSVVCTSVSGQQLQKITSSYPQINGRATAANDCAGGLVYDDGVFENAYTFHAADARMVQRFDPPLLPAKLNSVCVCWARTGSDSTINFLIDVYDDNGPSGQPGTLLASVPATASSVPTGLPGAFYSYDLNSAGVTTSGNVYIGVHFNGITESNFFVCADEGLSPSRPAYASIDGGAFWGSMPAIVGVLFESMGIRAQFTQDTTSCAPSATSLCLNNGRFRVDATYLTGAGQSGAAQVVKLTDQSGYLWFFSSENVEAVVKVLDACALNNKFWVFAGGLTNVQVTLTVTDTETGNAKTYTNPQGKAFQPIQDTSALPCN